MNTKSLESISFKPVTREYRSLVHAWLALPHVTEWFYGQGLQNTFNHLDDFLAGSAFSTYWLSFDENHPFAFLITSFIKKPEDALTRDCAEEGKAITLDMLIGDVNYIGKGIASFLIQKFLLEKFPDVTEVFIDPEASNSRAIHVYQKAGFKIIDEFVPSHSPHPHFMMRLNLHEIRRSF